MGESNVQETELIEQIYETARRIFGEESDIILAQAHTPAESRWVVLVGDLIHTGHSRLVPTFNGATLEDLLDDIKEYRKTRRPPKKSIQEWMDGFTSNIGRG
jgi:hypothetical protein